jgi:hypothetical protein
MNRHPAIGRLRPAGLALFAAAAMILAPAAVRAQTAPPPAAASLEVQTIKLLAVGSFTAGPERWKPLLPAEVRDTVRIYLTGKIDQWYVKQDQSGVVFLMNMSDPEAARALLATLPFGQAGLMKFEITPLGPISPLRVLLADPQQP